MPLKTKDVISAVQHVLSGSWNSQHDIVLDTVAKDGSWRVYVRDRFSSLRADANDSLHRAYTVGEQHVRRKLEEGDAGKQPCLKPWRTPGWFAILAYNQIFGWSGCLPEAEKSRSVILCAYQKVSKAFAVLDRRADPATGAIKEPPTRIEAPPPLHRALYVQELRNLRKLLRVLALGHMCERFEGHREWLKGAEFEEARKAVRYAYEALRADLAETAVSKSPNKRTADDAQLDTGWPAKENRGARFKEPKEEEGGEEEEEEDTI